MSFFFKQDSIASKKASVRDLRKIPLEDLWGYGCKACPLDRNKKMENPKMEDAGAKHPIFYFVGPAPSISADMNGHPLSLDDQEYLFDSLPREMKRSAGFSNVIKCVTPSDRDPTEVEVNCCHSRIEKDIEKRKPWAVIGLGSTPLKRFSGESNLMIWRGKRFPIRIGKHTCWYYCLPSLNSLVDSGIHDKRGGYRESPEEHIFTLELKKIHKEHKRESKRKIPIPFFEDKEQVLDGVKVLSDYSEKGYKKFCKVLDRFAEKEEFAIDYETQRLRPYFSDSCLLTASISDGEETYSFPLLHPRGWPIKLREKVKKKFKSFLSKSGNKIAHNANMEMEWSGSVFGIGTLYLKRRQDEVRWEDTMSQAYCLDQRPRKKGKTGLDLDSLVFQYFGIRMKSFFPLDKTNMIGEDLEEVLLYNGADAKMTYLLFEQQRKVLLRKENRRLLDFVYPHHIRTSRTLSSLSIKGLVPDLKETKRLDKKITKRLSEIKKELDKTSELKKFKRMSGKSDFNPESTQDVSFLFRDVLKRKEVLESTDEKALLSIPENEYKSPHLIIEYRSLNSRKGTNLEAIYTYTADDGRIHPNYNDKFTTTGRLSSSDPNLQNYPKHKNKYIRKVIKAPKGMKMVLGDYGAIEFRCAAMASRDEKLVESLNGGMDVHQTWANRFMEEDKGFLERIYEEYKIEDKKLLIKQARHAAKNGWVFPLIYGAAPPSLARYMKCTTDLAFELAGEFWEEHPGLKDWQNKTLRDYHQFGYVESLLGRRRQGPIKYNEVINTGIQGLASDITIDAQNRLDAETDFAQILNTHDEIGFYLNADTYKDDVLLIGEIMVFPDLDFINVPLIAEFEVGDNWADQKTLLVVSSTDFE